MAVSLQKGGENIFDNFLVLIGAHDYFAAFDYKCTVKI
jgi:hypothetical protein